MTEPGETVSVFPVGTTHGPQPVAITNCQFERVVIVLSAPNCMHAVSIPLTPPLPEAELPASISPSNGNVAPAGNTTADSAFLRNALAVSDTPDESTLRPSLANDTTACAKSTVDPDVAAMPPQSPGAAAAGRWAGRL